MLTHKDLGLRVFFLAPTWRPFDRGREMVPTRQEDSAYRLPKNMRAT